MTEREKILARVREALRISAPMPGAQHGSAHSVIGAPRSLVASARPAAAADARAWLPLAGQGFAERLALFQQNAAALKADFQLVDNLEALGRRLRERRDAEGWQKIGTHGGELTEFAAQQLGLPVCRTDAGYDVGQLEACDAGITGCDALVAQTGSVLVTSRSAGGRALSVLPPHHVVLARREQLLGDLPDAFAFLKHQYAPGYPSFISFITGPSRTGDIERILVLGAHGPKKLTIFCV